MLGLKDVSAMTGGEHMTQAYKTVPAYSVTYDGATWIQRPTTGPDFMLMTYDEARHSIAVQGNAFVDGEICMSLRRALGVVPDAAAEVAV